jgi:opacity protein-like surface antigen
VENKGVKQLSKNDLRSLQYETKTGEKMFDLFNKGRFATLFAFLSLAVMNSSLMAWESCNSCGCNRLYIGAFGGGIYANSTKLTQMGTAFFVEAEGGPLAIFGKGHSKKKSAGFGGVQIGYEWLQCPLYIGCLDWTLSPAVELEAYFYRNNKKGHLINSTDRLLEHDFADSFHMNMSVCLVNALFSLNNPSLWGFSPYVGGGIGATNISIRHAKSLQESPIELGINHFNSKRSDSSWAFAAQAKVGLRYKVCESFHIFGEYRYLFVDSSHYIFGSTVYPTHVPTSSWNVKVKNMHHNAFALGIQYDL